MLPTLLPLMLIGGLKSSAANKRTNEADHYRHLPLFSLDYLTTLNPKAFICNYWKQKGHWTRDYSICPKGQPPAFLGNTGDQLQWPPRPQHFAFTTDLKPPLWLILTLTSRTTLLNNSSRCYLHLGLMLDIDLLWHCIILSLDYLCSPHPLFHG